MPGDCRRNRLLSAGIISDAGVRLLCGQVVQGEAH